MDRGAVPATAVAGERSQAPHAPAARPGQPSRVRHRMVRARGDPARGLADRAPTRHPTAPRGCPRGRRAPLRSPLMPLAIAERALLDERRRLTRTEALAVARLPLDELPSLIALAHKVRLAWCGPEVELESLINAKSGACPEDCAFCSQSLRYDT